MSEPTSKRVRHAHNQRLFEIQAAADALALAAQAQMAQNTADLEKLHYQTMRDDNMAGRVLHTETATATVDDLRARLRHANHTVRVLHRTVTALERDAYYYQQTIAALTAKLERKTADADAAAAAASNGGEK